MGGGTREVEEEKMIGGEQARNGEGVSGRGGSVYLYIYVCACVCVQFFAPSQQQWGGNGISALNSLMVI